MEEKIPMWVGVPDGGMTEKEKKNPFACKLGGRATYPEGELGEAARKAVEEKMTCDICKDKMYLLAQAYCPVEEYDRILYVYACNSSHCHEKKYYKPWRVWRYQQKMKDYEEEEEEEEEEDVEIMVGKAEPWTFPEIAFDTFEEPKTTGTEEEEIKKAESASKELSNEISEEDLDSIEKSGCANLADEVIAKFQAKLMKCPNQVLRWGYGGKPLWMSTSDVPESIPRCSCGKPRIFELQIIPTIVYVLKCEQHLKPTTGVTDEGLDFGTACIYTCSEGCESEGIFEEYCHIQPPPRK
eukprot:TRINITY_DN2151_c0_g1_i1.p1 TRINITY_DN2151_c0_g1~~TRINITY_DN2151_c0_g1_i1.p1  ORF type:complete len:313 (+),score=99.75 TRINITY_DN2151_c0_g1_i1:49-939(+)